jgi:hypothetical protein
MAWSPLVELVTLEQAKQRVKLPDYGSQLTPEDEALQLQLLIAHEVVMDFLTQRVTDQDAWEAEVDAWDADTAPRRVIGAILEQFAFQYRFRGDDVEALKRTGDEVLCPTAAALLKRLRDPAVG